LFLQVHQNFPMWSCTSSTRISDRIASQAKQLIIVRPLTAHPPLTPDVLLGGANYLHVLLRHTHTCTYIWIFTVWVLNNMFRN
jgi:hypothetical protein